MLIRSLGITYLARTLLRFWVIFAGMMIANVCYAGYAGSLVDYDFPSEIYLVLGEPMEAELTVTVKNTGDQTWRAYNVQDPPNATPSWRWRAKNPSWKPCGEPNCTVYTFGVSHFVDVHPGEIKTSTMSPRDADLPDQVGEYFFTLECHYTEKDYPWIYYRPMDNSPVVIRFKVVSIGAISGRITDSEGDPIPGLEVLAHSDISRSELLGKATTDGKGNYTIERVRAGAACISIERDGAIVWYDGQEGTEDAKEAIVLHVKAGQTISRINIGDKRIRAMPWLSPLLLGEDQKLPAAGLWTALTDFGTLEFSVNPEGTGITQIAFDFKNFSCGGATHNGGIAVTPATPWSITESQFTIKTPNLAFSGTFIITISGTFDNTGRHASGTWEVLSDGTKCSGTWNATK